MIEIKACPFCGSEAELSINVEGFNRLELYCNAQIKCKECGCSKKTTFVMGWSMEYVTESVVKNWNRRANND